MINSRIRSRSSRWNVGSSGGWGPAGPSRGKGADPVQTPYQLRRLRASYRVPKVDSAGLRLSDNIGPERSDTQDGFRSSFNDLPKVDSALLDALVETKE